MHLKITISCISTVAMFVPTAEAAAGQVEFICGVLLMTFLSFTVALS